MKFIILSLFVFKAYGSIPNYDNAKLIARSSLSDSQMMPVSSLFVDATPTINNKRSIGIPLSVIEAQEISGIWIYEKGEYRVPYYRLDQFRVSNFRLNDAGEMIFTVYDDYFYEDLIYGKFFDNEFHFSSIKDQFNVKKIKSISPTDIGYLIFGAVENKVILSHINGKSNLLVEESKNNLSYLFTPAFNKVGSFIYKARLGKPGQWSENQPDIIKLTTNKSTYLVAEDKDANPNSKWISLRNSVSINNNNEVCFFGVDNTSKTSLILYRDGHYYEIAKEGSGGIKSLDYFSAVMNNTGHIAFRAKDDNDLTAIYLSDGSAVQKIISQNDLIGEFRISYGPHIPFGGNIGLNDRGDIVINSGLSSPDGLKDKGRGIITIFSKEN